MFSTAIPPAYLSILANRTPQACADTDVFTQSATLGVYEAADLVKRLHDMSADAVAALASAHDAVPVAASVRARYDWFAFDHIIVGVLNDEEMRELFDRLGVQPLYLAMIILARICALLEL